MGNQNTLPKSVEPPIQDNDTIIQENLLNKFKYLLDQGKESDRRSPEEFGHDKDQNLFNKFNYLLGTSPVSSVALSPVSSVAPSHESSVALSPVSSVAPSHVQIDDKSHLLTKFKYLIKNDDVDDYIAEVTTFENGKITEKTKRIKINDFMERPTN
jgi:hypothetical protein